MREIKIRGKRLDNGEWMYGDLLHLVDGVYISNDNGNNMAQIDTDTVVMNTGLKDKKGKDIYDGDILAHNGVVINDFNGEVEIAVNIHDSHKDCGALNLKNK